MDDQASGLRREMTDKLEQEQRKALGDWDKRLENGPPDNDAVTLREIDRTAGRILVIVGIVFVLLAVAAVIWSCWEKDTVAHAHPGPDVVAPPVDIPSDFFFKGRVSIGDWTPEFEADEQKKCEKMGGIFGRTINLELERVYWHCSRGSTEPPALIPDPVLPRMNEPGTKPHRA